MSEAFYITDSLVADVPNASPGRLGLIAIDPRGRHVVSLTARHIAGETGALLIDGDKRAEVSSYRIPQRFKEIGRSGMMYKPAECLLAFAKFKSGRFGETYRSGAQTPSGFSLKQPVMPSFDLLSNDVLLHIQGGEPKTASVASIAAYFRMPDPLTGELQIFGEAIEVQAEDEQSVTSRGDTGSVVTDLDGRPIGIVVCAVDDSSFIAPVWDVFERIEGLVALEQSYLPEANDLLAASEKIIEFEEIGSGGASIAEKKRLHAALETGDVETELELAEIIEEKFL